MLKGVKKHLKTTTHCIKTDNEITEFMLANKKSSKYVKTCNNCHKNFTRYDNYNGHISNLTCEKYKEDTNIEAQITLLKIKKEKLEKLLQEFDRVLNE